MSTIDWTDLQKTENDEGNAWLKSVAGEDADVNNLTRDQKVAIYKAILSGNGFDQNWWHDWKQKISSIKFKNIIILIHILNYLLTIYL